MNHPFQKPMPENALPPEEVIIEDLRVEPWEDMTRLKIFVKISPFQKPANLHFELFNQEKKKLTEVAIIENTEIQFVFTIHLKSTAETGEYQLKASLDYGEDFGVTNSKTINFSLLS
ncbi:MAG: hypothetical protein CVU39_05995 [Chloroflexi bacterium HGW-Chloroflexi-10]|nr:MAG: hypothetical protein CVU39_05995 [Chloroflexi bacterium HGW-Chloroflexi-10]